MEKEDFVYPRSPIDSLVTEKALNIVNGSDYEVFTNAMIEDNPGAFPVKNVCAKLSISLSDEIDNICSLLSLSKREFIQAALSEAVGKAYRIIDTEGVWHAVKERNGG